MLAYLSKSLWLLLYSVIVCCVLYPLGLWLVGQTFFPFQANGSLLMGPDGKPVGSKTHCPALHSGGILSTSPFGGVLRCLGFRFLLPGGLQLCPARPGRPVAWTFGEISERAQGRTVRGA